MLDIFTVGVSDKLDERQAQDLKAFAADYRAHGEGRILIEVPKAPERTRAAEATLALIRRALAANGG